ncbi:MULTISPECIES: protein-methionine-sulfoxide reductase catalytic subunit MsrP [unclassified Herbaspirillum]|uniref:protein-methionine-sulfoxide reductase catalytic subunit MsrP n=1 Tax=unclassified Herbaspirillum TaxID=2624150 RepID=UPI000E2EA13E|nr:MULTISPECIES: protein-methionine-sulfoxide reductase catalytic subunit MsrP [unclassified Herbaspirillum]RFB67612.1 protein-methionine-sulfoxide reductase catalytic subunit MsrP [Herbaspirillum sp. 3R-3a1]TFI05220.1 protein-methionine-sulfoxide reductase catalytic subunit MsrP [Herbaspirillum sp. 3R11]TFI12450.1 protein-methionine-sulfoxide reductase catalytic subunit MsrP [Herbaspirillum sp. 3R-11]TFI22829.1 protein-methionine-sulfoxide reductase catalytic subunit MsrP [Herbaspirillum sp. 3
MFIKRQLRNIDVPLSSEITPRALFESRRDFMRHVAVGSIAGGALLETMTQPALAQTPGAQKLTAKPNSAYVVMDKQTSFKDASTYNNFYEFGTDKGDPAQNAGTLKTRPWTIAIEGEVKKPLTLDIDALLKLAPLEERIYRLRCVEGWSMVIPWIGYSLSELIKKAEPTGNAKYIEFITLDDKKQMPGVYERVLQWPYTEGLRLDEANHPLTLLTVGMYGEVLPNQNGAPVRVVVPWKYGFKSAKSIVKIRFLKEQPKTAWNVSAPQEYGFYSNVNPNVDHPRWSQASERRIGEDGFLARKRKTLMFNGYNEVAPLYAGMDLKKFF